MQVLGQSVTPGGRFTYHRAPDVRQTTLGFVFGKLQRVDVLQTSFIFPHLLADDQLHTPKKKKFRHSVHMSEF